jgi:hypothetical protein
MSWRTIVTSKTDQDIVCPCFPANTNRIWRPLAQVVAHCLKLPVFCRKLRWVFLCAFQKRHACIEPQSLPSWLTRSRLSTNPGQAVARQSGRYTDRAPTRAVCAIAITAPRGPTPEGLSLRPSPPISLSQTRTSLFSTGLMASIVPCVRRAMIKSCNSCFPCASPPAPGIGR